MVTANEEMTTPATATPAMPERTRSGRTYRPNVDIVEGRDELTVFADLPGADPQNVDIHFENGTLSIYARVEQREPRQGGRWLLREYGVGDFYRTFQVSEVVDSQRISAEFDSGVLILHLPKVEAAKPRRIEVRTAGGPESELRRMQTGERPS